MTRTASRVALDAGDMDAHAAASTALRTALAGAVALEAAERLGSVGACSRSRRTRPRRMRAASARPTPLAGDVEASISDAGDVAGLRAHQLGIRAYASERRLVDLGRVGIVLAFIVFGALWWMLRQQRRRLDAARLQELSPPERDGVERTATACATTACSTRNWPASCSAPVGPAIRWRSCWSTSTA